MFKKHLITEDMIEDIVKAYVIADVLINEKLLNALSKSSGVMASSIKNRYGEEYKHIHNDDNDPYELPIGKS